MSHIQTTSFLIYKLACKFAFFSVIYKQNGNMNTAKQHILRYESVHGRSLELRRKFNALALEGGASKRKRKRSNSSKKKKARVEETIDDENVEEIITEMFENENKEDWKRMMREGGRHFVDLKMDMIELGWGIIDGGTALHYAVAMDNVVATKVLLKHGASVNISDNHGYFPLDYSLSADMFKLLERKGGLLNRMNPINLVYKSFHIATYEGGTGDEDLIEYFAKKNWLDVPDRFDDAIDIYVSLKILEAIGEHVPTENIQKFFEDFIDGYSSSMDANIGELGRNMLDMIIERGGNIMITRDHIESVKDYPNMHRYLENKREKQIEKQVETVSHATDAAALLPQLKTYFTDFL